MIRFKFLISALCTMMILQSCSEDNPDGNDNTTKPNILLIIADDFGLDACPNYSVGAVKPDMPHIQEMANTGITFDNFWAYPMCSPTRASIITGKYGVKTGVLNATNAATIGSDEQTLQAYLDKNLGKVYSHSIVGKWHLSNGEPNRPTQMGVDYYAGLLGGSAKSYYDWDLVENGISKTSTDYITTKITDLAIDWINTQDKSWFCWLAYTAPHTPFHLPPSEMHSQGNLPTDQESIDANPQPYFMAMAESIDYEIGRLLDRIPQDDLLNTIIIFMGDNGTPGKVVQSPYVNKRSKGSLYQGGISVPLIVSGHGVSRIGERDINLISSTDLFSTIAQIAGVEASTYENSYSFKSLLSGRTTSARTYNYSEVLNDTEVKSGFTIRNSTYKLMKLDNGSTRFYNLVEDPFENNNLINKLSEEEQAAYDQLNAKAGLIRG